MNTTNWTIDTAHSEIAFKGKAYDDFNSDGTFWKNLLQE